MLVLVLEFSKISATTLDPAPISGDQGTSWSERPLFRASLKERCRSSKTEDESPDLRDSHLTGTQIVQVRKGHSPVV